MYDVIPDAQHVSYGRPALFIEGVAGQVAIGVGDTHEAGIRVVVVQRLAARLPGNGRKHGLPNDACGVVCMIDRPAQS